jgi:hypothetical protein
MDWAEESGCMIMQVKAAIDSRPRLHGGFKLAVGVADRAGGGGDEFNNAAGEEMPGRGMWVGGWVGKWAEVENKHQRFKKNSKRRRPPGCPCCRKEGETLKVFDGEQVDGQGQQRGPPFASNGPISGPAVGEEELEGGPRPLACSRQVMRACEHIPKESITIIDKDDLSLQLGKWTR